MEHTQNIWFFHKFDILVDIIVHNSLEHALTPGVWHKLQTGELKISTVAEMFLQGLKNEKRHRNPLAETANPCSEMILRPCCKSTKGTDMLDPLRFGKKLSFYLQIVFINTPLLYSNQATHLEFLNLFLKLVPTGDQSAWISQETHAIQSVMLSQGSYLRILLHRQYRHLTVSDTI